MVKDSSISLKKKSSLCHESKKIPIKRNDDKRPIIRKPESILKIHETSENNPTRKRPSLDAPRSITTKFVSKDSLVQPKTKSKVFASKTFVSDPCDIKASKGNYSFDGQSRNSSFSKGSTTEDIINIFKYRNKASLLTKTSETKTQSYEDRPIEQNINIPADLEEDYAAELEVDANDEWIMSMIASKTPETSWKTNLGSSAEEEELTDARSIISLGRGMATSNVGGPGPVSGTDETSPDGTKVSDPDTIDPNQNVDQVERIRNKVRKISEQLNELRELQDKNSFVKK